MFYSPWGRKTEVAFHDKAFERAALPPWDSRWHALSVAARAHFLDKVKAPARPGGYRPSAPSTRFPAQVLDELAAAGFVEVQTRGARADVVIAEEAVPFAIRLRAVRRYRLLADGGEPEVVKYTAYCFVNQGLQREVEKVLQAA